MTLHEILRDFWSFVLAIFSVFAFTLKVAFQVSELDKDFRRELIALRDQRREDKAAAEVSRTEMMDMLREIRTDIKQMAANRGDHT